MNEPARQIAAHDPVQTLATRYGQTYSQALHQIEQLTDTLRQLQKEHDALREHGLLIDADLGAVGNAAQAAWRTTEAHKTNHAAIHFRAAAHRVTEPYDPVEHHRERARKAEARIRTLEHELSKTIRLLTLAVRAAASNECDPHTLLRVLEQHDKRNNRLEHTLRLLQATNV